MDDTKGLTDEEKQCLERTCELTDEDREGYDDPNFQQWIEYKGLHRKLEVLIETQDIDSIEKLIKEFGKKIGLEDTSPSLASEVEEWVLSTKGVFLSTEVMNSLHLSTRKDKRNVYTILRRLVEKEVIKPTGGRNGCYRLVENEIELVDWKSSKGAGVDINLSFDLHDKIKLFHGNIILITGRKDSGKTATCLDIAKRNRDVWEVRYGTSEMGDDELGIRLRYHKDMAEEEWDKVTFFMRNRNFADVIKKGALNIFDFLELKQGATFEIGDRLQEIHEALGYKGIAVVACQLDRGKYIARGGASSLDKPRLYVALYDSTARIISAKNWKSSVNPRDQVCHFKLHHGATFEQIGLWHDEGSDPGCEYCKRNMKEPSYS